MLFIAGLIAVFFSLSSAQELLQASCNLEATTTSSTQRGGRYITASGSLNVLFVYIQFPDDNYLPNNTYWPKGQAPAYMDATIDSVWSSTPTQGSFSDYFNQMSFNTFKITGKSISAITPHSRNWYLNNNWKRGDIQKEVIQSLDVTIDFAQFDHWRFNSEYSQTDTADGVVDMIIMMWRNVCNDTVDVRSRLDLIPGGEASLGYYDRNYNTSFTVDNGARTIQMGYSGYGSGITAIHPRFGDLNRDLLWRYARHEFGHWLLGGNEYHTKLGTWGLLDGWGAPSGCMNSYERYKLGWMNFNTIDDITTTRTIFNNTMPDFITADSAYRIKVPGGGTDEYYLLGNHQRSSIFDIPDNNVSTATGIFVLLQTYDQGNAVSIVSADGRFDWSVPYQSPNIYGGTGNLPVFLRGTANRINGYSKRQNIPWYWQGIYQGTAPIHYYQNQYGTLVQAPPTIFTGDGKDQFDLNNSTVFSSASNPSSDIHSNTNKIGFEIIGYNSTTGIYTVNIHINTTENAAPSKPQDVVATLNLPNQTSLTWTANQETDIVVYNIYRGVVYTGSGEPSYTKINSTPITMAIYTDNNYESITGLPQNIDLYHRYRITAVDNQGKESVKSELVDAYFTHVASGTISSNKTYIINVNILENVTVQNNVTLTINPGTRVVFENGKTLTVNGKLIAKGTPTQRITFTSANPSPSPGYWGGDYAGIFFNGSGPDTLSYCTIKYANTGLRFFNTASSAMVDYCLIDSCSIGGISISGLSNNSKVVTIRSSTISNNRERGISISNALADIKHTSIINNGNYVVGPGLTVSFARVYLSNSRIENNLGTGIIITGQGSNVIFSPDGTAPGYNFVTSHGVGEINIRNNGYAYIGQRYQYICRWDCDGIVELTTLNSSPDAIEPGPCRPIYCWANMAGLNNIYNNYNYFRRLINNETGNTIYAQNTYWGNSSGPNPAQDFYGNVVYIPFLTSPASTSAPMVPEQPIEEELAVTYIRSIEDNSTNALDALYGLESLSDLGVNLNTNIKMPWENFLNRIERRANSVKLKNLASAFRIKDKMRRKDFSSAISLSDVYLQNNSNDGMWMYYQVQKIFANIGNGDINTAESIYNIIKSRAYSIDSISTLAIGEIVSMLGTNNLNLSKSSTSDKLKIEKENSISPSSFILHQNYPNPFNPVAKIKFLTPEAGFVTLKVYDVLGREISELVSGWKEAGTYEVEWDGARFSSGVYFYKLVASSIEPLGAGNYTRVHKMLLAK